MKQIFTLENKNYLLAEVRKLEEFVEKSKDNDKILDSYFPHTIYELDCVLTQAIGKEIDYFDVPWFKKII